MKQMLRHSLSSGRGVQLGRWRYIMVLCMMGLWALWYAFPPEGGQYVVSIENRRAEVRYELKSLDGGGAQGFSDPEEVLKNDSLNSLNENRSSINELDGGPSLSIRKSGKEITAKDSERCDRTEYPAAWELKSDQLTILISGFAEARLPLLQKHVRMYSLIPIVHSIYVLWSNTSTPDGLLEELDFESLGAPIHLVRQQSTSLNDRFLPRRDIKTRAVMICDDDITVEPKSLIFALQVWREEQSRIIGFFPRSHAYELDSKSWMYVKQQGKYSIMLTKMMILATEYLYVYTCEMPRGVKEYVGEVMNCEDIAMNFLVSSHGGKGPLLVEGKPRDWGDTRNKYEEDAGVSALSGRVGHTKTRGKCIAAFQKLWNGMQLKFSHTKVVPDLAEQVSCEKFGYLVDCESHVSSKRDARRYVGENMVSYTLRYAYVTFLPSDLHVNLSMLLAQSLRSSGTVHDLVLLVDPSCTVEQDDVLHEHYDKVVIIQHSDTVDQISHLGKLNAWLLTDYQKVVYIEIDSIVLFNLDHLFLLPELAAAPQTFMPGKFSTGLLVMKPSNATYSRLIRSLGRVQMLTNKRRQYLLNSYFGGWFKMPVENRLPARYNLQVVFSKKLQTPVWFDVNRAYELLGPPMVLRYGSSRISSRHVDRAFGIVNSWCVSRFRLFEALEDNEFHPLDDDNMTVFSWVHTERWNESDIIWPPPPLSFPISTISSIEKPASKEAFVTVLWKEEKFTLAGWAETFYHLHGDNLKSREVLLLVSSSVNPDYYVRFRSYFDEIKIVSPFVSNGRRAHGSFTLLHLWNQTDYDKLVYVASTSLFVDNANSLWDYNPFAAVSSVFPSDAFSSEVMVIQPDLQVYCNLQERLAVYDYPGQPVEPF